MPADRNRDKAIGAYAGAAIGDAMGGPIECTHAARIQRLVGEVTGLLPYQEPYTIIDLHPGYALQPDAGSVTDDTFIRGDLTRFFLEIEPPRTPELLAEWMLANADFDMWWRPAVQALERVQRGDVSPAESGATWHQGGGVGWWTPVGILYAGDPARAAEVAGNLSRIWKAPLEQSLVGAVQAGVAEAMRDEATADDVVQTILDYSSPLAHRLLERGLAVADAAQDRQQLIEGLYYNVLLPTGEEPPREADGPMPESAVPLEDTDEHYSSVYLSEQIPLAVAAFAFEHGDARRAIPTAAMMGRDADTIATTVGSWVGALHGESGLPQEWVETVYTVNKKHIDIRGLAEAIADLPE